MKPTHRYLFVLRPSPEVTAKVQRMREQLYPRIGNFSGRRVIPHITLCFADVTDNEERAINQAAGAVAACIPFTLHYAGITHFPDRRTIFIDPVEKEAIRRVREPLVTALRAEPSITSALHVTDHPHLTIAAGLKPAQFATAWDLLAPHWFEAEERVTEVVLMRRELKPEALYSVIGTFALRPSD